MTREKIVVACDLGGSIIDKMTERSREMFLGPDYLLTEAVPGAFEALRSLVEATRGEDGKCNVYVVSACETALRGKARWWLDHRQFSEQTGIPPANVLFCGARGVKAGLYADLGVTHAIDDRIEVLSCLAAVTKKFIFRQDQNEIGVFPAFIPELRLAESWPEIVGAILKDG